MKLSEKNWGNKYKVNDKIEESKENWKQHLTGINSEGMLLMIYKYRPRGKRDVNVHKKVKLKKNTTGQVSCHIIIKYAAY